MIIMKMKLNKIFILCSIMALAINNSFASDKSFVVNPTTIRTQLLSRNMTLLQALNNVQNSKLNVSMARAKLLPSLNLATLLPGLANPTFLLASVTFLFPFLIPSNWAVLKQQKQLFESDKASYKALQLNVLSNSLSLYYTFVNDQSVQNALRAQSEVLGQLYSHLKKQSDVLGNVSGDDLSMASAQWEDSKLRVSKMAELLIEERAALRTLLSLPLGNEMVVEDTELAESEYEFKSATEITERSLNNSPEVQQLSFLILAAKAGKFAKLFGFMNSASLSGTASADNSPFEGMKVSGGFSFGADNLVNLKIANNNVQAIVLRAEQLKQENEKTAEIVMGQISEVKDQQLMASKAYNDHLYVYESQKRQYALGLISLQTLLMTQSQLTDSLINNIKADLDLKMQRLTLLRLVIDGDFAKVQGCLGTPDESKGIFRRNKSQTLDQVCLH